MCKPALIYIYVHFSNIPITITAVVAWLVSPYGCADWPGGYC